MAEYTILLVDYEPRSIEQLRVPLERAGYVVEVAKDGQAGRTRFDELQPKLVLVEAMLPKKHGFELCRELKLTDTGRDIPVVIITAVYKGRKYRNRARADFLCDAYLEKPISDEDLLSTVNGLLGAPSPAKAPPLGAAGTAAVPPAQPAAAAPASPAAKAQPAGAQPDTTTDSTTDSTEAEINDHLDSILS